MAMNDRPRILLDTSALLAWIKDEPESEDLADLLEYLDRGEGVLVESTLLLAELYRRVSDRPDWQQRMDSILGKLRSRDVVLLDVTRPVAERAAQYRSAHRLKTPDAIHLATAALNGCTWLVTLDADFPAEVDGVKIFNLRTTNESPSMPWKSAVQGSLFADSESSLGI